MYSSNFNCNVLITILIYYIIKKHFEESDCIFKFDFNTITLSTDFKIIQNNIIFAKI